MTDDHIRVMIDDGAAPRNETGPTIEQLNRQAATYRAEAAHLRAEAAHLRKFQVDTGIQAADTTIASTKSALAECYDESERSRLTEALVDAKLRRAVLEGQAAGQRQPVPADPVEAYAAGRSEPTKNWLREHRDWVEDPKKNARLTSAHWAAVAEGHQPDSTDYFDFVEQRIGLRPGGSNAQRKSDLSTVNRGDPNTHLLDNGSSVYLTDGERQQATDGTLTWSFGPNRGRPIGLTEMARRKRELIKQGAYVRMD
jgi:hypothetical protein